MAYAIHSNAFRDMSYSRATKYIKERWPEALIEASTCREHLGQVLRDWHSVFKFIIEEDWNSIGAVSGGWVDFATGVGVQSDGYADKQVVIASAWGIPLRLFLCNPTLEPENSREHRIAAASMLGGFVKRWNFAETNICIENHGGITANPLNVQEVLDLASNLAEKRVYTTLDPINYATCGMNPWIACKAIRSESIGLVHVKDIDANGHYTIPGMGLYTKEWHKILDYLMVNDYKGTFTIEYEGKDLEHRDQYIDKAIEFLAEYIDE